MWGRWATTLGRRGQSLSATPPKPLPWHMTTQRRRRRRRKRETAPTAEHDSDHPHVTETSTVNDAPPIQRNDGGSRRARSRRTATKHGNGVSHVSHIQPSTTAAHQVGQRRHPTTCSAASWDGELLPTCARTRHTATAVHPQSVRVLLNDRNRRDKCRRQQATAVRQPQRQSRSNLGRPCRA